MTQKDSIVKIVERHEYDLMQKNFDIQCPIINEMNDIFEMMFDV